jgi:orotate phosphoribosyltransferase
MIHNILFAQEIATKLIEIGAVKINTENPFTWASGTISPVYCDNRLTLGYPEIRQSITQGFSEIITQKFPQTDLICGVATAGIPHATLIANQLE